MTYDDTPELPDFLNRKLNPREYTPEEQAVLNRTIRAHKAAAPIWPKKQIERVMKAKARAERLARKDKAKREAQKAKNQ